MPPSHRARAALACAWALGALGCPGAESSDATAGGEAPGAAPPSIALVTIDTLRADHCSAYGYPRPTTPHLDGLAAAGALFEVAYTPVPTTLPAHATLFTSLYSAEHGVRRNGEPLSADVTTLTEILARAGYQTAAFLSSYAVDAVFGLDQGFARYDDDFADTDSEVPGGIEWAGRTVEEPFDRRAGATTDAAVRWLEERDRVGPFFLWVHYFDPHQPLRPREPFRSQFARPDAGDPRAHTVDAYDAEVRYADEHLGRLLRALDRVAPGALALVTSDHGEGLWDHGWLEHGVNLYEESARIPLVVRWPGRIAAGQRVAAPVGLIDVAPTLLGLAGVAAPGIPLQGRDLSPVLTAGAEADVNRRVFLRRRTYEIKKLFHRRIAGPAHAVRWRHWKLIQAPQELGVELYDLDRDPGELRNVAGLHPHITENLLAEIGDWRRALRARPRAGALPEDVRRRLEALGYAP